MDPDVVMCRSLGNKAAFGPDQESEGDDDGHRELESLEVGSALALPPRVVVVQWPAAPPATEGDPDGSRSEHGNGRQEPEKDGKKEDALEVRPDDRDRNLRQQEGDGERKPDP